MCLALFAETGSTFYDTYIIGDFEVEEAHRFIDYELRKIDASPISKEDWELVHKVCALL